MTSKDREKTIGLVTNSLLGCKTPTHRGRGDRGAYIIGLTYPLTESQPRSSTLPATEDPPPGEGAGARGPASTRVHSGR